MRPSLAVAAATSLLFAAPACKVYDPLYCDVDRPCTDPARPFCDLHGEYPASEGIAHTCIPTPSSAADGGSGLDAGRSDGGPQPDALAGSRRVVQLAVGGSHSCAVLSDGALRCWGQGTALGYADAEDIGDDEHPYEAGDVVLGGIIKQVAAGSNFTCGLYKNGNVRCWGSNYRGKLGYGDSIDRIGPDFVPALLQDIDVGGIATQVVAGINHACALLESGDVRCWGDDRRYQLATPDQENVGDDETPGSRDVVPLGGRALSISAGYLHTCALMLGGTIRCWGTVVDGPVGYVENDSIVGDDETPSQMGDIDLGGPARQVAVGTDHTCALMESDRVRCWGNGDKKVPAAQVGVLGYRELRDVGDDEAPAALGDVSLGGPASEVAAGGYSRCARLEGSVRCWGRTSLVMGYGRTEMVGDDELPSDVGDVVVGAVVTALALPNGSNQHMCVALVDGGVRCWGRNNNGQLGLSSTQDVGDNDVPADFPEVRLLE